MGKGCAPLLNAVSQVGGVGLNSVPNVDRRSFWGRRSWVRVSGVFENGQLFWVVDSGGRGGELS